MAVLCELLGRPRHCLIRRPCVDSKFCSILYDNVMFLLPDDSLLQQLMEHLQKHYADTPPDTDACWEVGQAVICRYTLDDQFYRAQVTKIASDSTVEVDCVTY